MEKANSMESREMGEVREEFIALPSTTYRNWADKERQHLSDPGVFADFQANKDNNDQDPRRDGNLQISLP